MSGDFNKSMNTETNRSMFVSSNIVSVDRVLSFMI